MIGPRRLRAWTCLAALALLALETSAALAQGKFPARPIRIVSPFAAGSVSDLSLRLFADKLAARVNGQVIMDNQPRAGGVTAATSVLSAPPDGYTIALFSTSTAISVSLFKQLPYDPVRDFAPVSSISTFANILATNINSKYASLAEVIAAARAKPGSLNFGTTTVGSTNHLAATLFKAMTGLDVVIVPYRTPGDLLTAALRNDVDVIVQSYGALKTAVADKQLRALASTTAGPRRLSAGGAVGARGRRHGLRGGDLERVLRAGEDASGRDRADQPGDPRGAAGCRAHPALHRARPRAAAEHAAGARRAHDERDRQMGARHQRGRHREAVMAMVRPLMSTRRQFIASVAALATTGFARRSGAQAPSQSLLPVLAAKPVRLLVGFAPGGNSDGIARLVGHRLGDRLGQQFVIENRAGANGTLAAEATARAPADGYTLFMAALPHLAIAPAMGKLPYDPIKDFAPISNVGTNPFVLVVHPSFPARTLPELVEHVRKTPGKIAYASGGNGSLTHLSMALFASAPAST